MSLLKAHDRAQDGGDPSDGEEHRPDPVFGAQVAQKKRHHQRVGLVAVELQEARQRDILALGRDQMPEVLHLEQALRPPARKPGRSAHF